MPLGSYSEKYLCFGLRIHWNWHMKIKETIMIINTVIPRYEQTDRIGVKFASLYNSLTPSMNLGLIGGGCLGAHDKF